MTPPINSVSDERLARIIKECADAEGVQVGGWRFKSDFVSFSDIGSLASELAARRAANTPVGDDDAPTADRVYDDIDDPHKTGLADLMVPASPALPSQVVAVSVKPLEWQQPTGPWTFVAKVLNLEYRVSEGFGEDAMWELRLFNTLVGAYANSEEAKAAAQADFNARIQACLTSPAAEPVAEARAALLAEVIALIEDDMYGPGEAEDSPTRTEFNKALRRQINRITSRLTVQPALLAALPEMEV